RGSADRHRSFAALLRQREAEDLLHHAPRLLAERRGVVRHAVARADRLHLHGHLRITMRRDVREEVMLDLMTEVPAHEVHEPAALEVRGAEDLAVVPSPA